MHVYDYSMKTHLKPGEESPIAPLFFLRRSLDSRSRTWRLTSDSARYHQHWKTSVRGSYFPPHRQSQHPYPLRQWLGQQNERLADLTHIADQWLRQVSRLENPQLRLRFAQHSSPVRQLA